MQLAVIGTGYVGLVAGTCFAENGHHVVCIDKDESKIKTLLSGGVPIYEPGLAELIARNVKHERLSFTTDLAQGVTRADVIFIAVGTPENEDGSADLTHVLAVARAIGAAMTRPAIVVNKSTVPVGTADKVKAAIEQVTKIPVEVVSNPEFLKEGAAIDDFLKPDRIVIGTESAHARDVMTELYAPFNRTSNRVVHMDTRSAEMTKYVANAMLATRISFMNEVANLCERVGADVEKVRAGVGTDPRIGKYFLFPGVGYGGSCFPKDVLALLKTSNDAGVPFQILKAVDEVNDRQKLVLVDKVVNVFGDDLAGKKFAIWGIAFKPQTDDIREAPAVKIMEQLVAKGATISANDPEAMKNAAKVFGDKVQFEDDQYKCLQGADALLIVTEWNEYRAPDFAKMKETMKRPIVLDGRNIYSPEGMRQMGFTYSCIGRK